MSIHSFGFGQQAPYQDYPEVAPPYYRVRFEASEKPDGLAFPVAYTLWLPPGVDELRGVIVHQHGCGTGSCRSGRTGAFDLHWQALAREHDCGLLSPTYEQPEDADCQLWCDPRNGSDASFRRGLAELGTISGHPELALVPWALWGHSGGGHWAGGMANLHPERVAAAWLRSGVPLFAANPNRPSIRPHELNPALVSVPLMCNLGTNEGVSDKTGRFAGVWPAVEAFFQEVRGRNGIVGVAIDPLTSHECGNQRYLAIPWLDACLAKRLPKEANQPLRPMPHAGAWLADTTGQQAYPVGEYQGEPNSACWLPDSAIAQKWMQYVKDTQVADTSPPPSPLEAKVEGGVLRWTAHADLESGLARFIIERDGKPWLTLPDEAKNRFGRPLFQNLQYSDTPTEPLVTMQIELTGSQTEHTYRVAAENTVGLRSEFIEATTPQ